MYSNEERETKNLYKECKICSNEEHETNNLYNE
jgi:hypothetical protein